MRKSILSLTAAVTLVAAVACGDAPTAAPSPEPAARGALLGVVALTPALERSRALPADVTVRARIGPEGGALAIPEAGLRVVVPRGAVAAPVDFRVTAIAGKAVAYDFDPHGISFARPLQVTQDLRGTEWLGLPLLNFRAVYFKDRSQVDPLRALIAVDEILPLSLDLLRLQVRFDVEHFSGYGISTGRSSRSTLDAQ